MRHKNKPDHGILQQQGWIPGREAPNRLASQYDTFARSSDSSGDSLQAMDRHSSKLKKGILFISDNFEPY